MGSCIFNNVAIAAIALAESGARVAILDWDVHHGNGTQEIFWADDRVLYVSLHQEVTFPGSGNAHERGPMASGLTTVNLPLPAGATGDVYLAVVDEIVTPVVTGFAPDWVLVSCGFDASQADPLAAMALTPDDFAHLATRVAAMAAPGRLVLFLEGGYDLEALEASTAAVLRALTTDHSDPALPSTGGPGRRRTDEFARIWLADD
jgi:acetoin utilization deacetylase AcuC-like enzyme